MGRACAVGAAAALSAGLLSAVAFLLPAVGPQVQPPRALRGGVSASEATPPTSPLAATGAAVLVAAVGLSLVRQGGRSVAPSARAAGPTVLEGTGGPFPQDFWDPAGLAKGKSDDELRMLRAQELKHGRVAMIAALGWFHVAAGYHPVGDTTLGRFVSNDPFVNAQEVPLAGWVQYLFAMMILEWTFEIGPLKPNKKYPWDLIGWDEFVADNDTHEPWKEVQLREINNGRLAMIGIVGMVAQRAATGDYQANFVFPTAYYPIFDPSNFVQPFPIFPGYYRIEDVSPVFGPFAKVLFGPGNPDGIRPITF